MQFPALFESGRLGKLTAPNRLVMPPMVMNYADAHGRVTERYLAHMRRVAEGGVGTMILEASYVADDGKGFACQLGIHSDDLVPGLRLVVDVAHAAGALIGPQLYHAGRQTSAKITGETLLAPSPLPCPLMQEVPREMTQADIDRVVDDFAQAARRAKEAGFDFVEVHGAHGYLLMQFLSPFSNVRSDDYGGSFENRLRFPLQVVNAVREAVGEEFTIIYRISAEEEVPGGLTLEESTQAAKALERAGVDVLHVSVGSYGSYVKGRMIPPMSQPDAINAGLAEAMKRAVSIPVIAVGKCRRPETGERLLAEGGADFIGIGRTLLADPEWPLKVRDGRLDEINFCIACNQGCITRLFEQHDVWCTVNPETGREIEFESMHASAGTSARVTVVGGGPAGLAAAITAAKAGASVTLFEREDHLGGQLPAAAAAPHRQDWKLFETWLEGEARRQGVDVRLSTTAGVDAIFEHKPDLVVIASGAHPVRAGFDNVENTPVLSGRDVLEGRATATGRVVVVGGGCSGVQAAEFLSERGHDVTIIESGTDIAADMPVDERHLALARLHERGVAVHAGERLLRVTNDGIETRSPSGDQTRAADSVLLCLGSSPEDGLVDELMRRGLNVATVGDARRPRRVTDAVAEAAMCVLYFLAEQQARQMPRTG